MDVPHQDDWALQMFYWVFGCQDWSGLFSGDYSLDDHLNVVFGRLVLSILSVSVEQSVNKLAEVFQRFHVGTHQLLIRLLENVIFLEVVDHSSVPVIIGKHRSPALVLL